MLPPESNDEAKSINLKMAAAVVEIIQVPSGKRFFYFVFWLVERGLPYILPEGNARHP